MLPFSQQAEERSRELLLEHLTPEQRDQLATEGYFQVKGEKGNFYRITTQGQLRANRFPGSYEYMGATRHWGNICIYLGANPYWGYGGRGIDIGAVRFTPSQQALALKLMLETNEDGVWIAYGGRAPEPA